MKKLVMTGGGTAGHVTPNIAMLPRLRGMGFEIYYIGTYDGIERKLIEDAGVDLLGKAPPVFQYAEFFGSLPRDQGFPPG